MKNLAIDTSSEVCGVALLEDDKLIDDNSLNNGRTHSENLMVLIKEVLERNNLNVSDLDLISCTVGPGSFTGIRIGVASVKALVEGCEMISGKCPKIAAMTSLEVLAQAIENSETKVALIDARNDQVYCGIFDKEYNLLEDYIGDSIEVAISKMSNYSNITVCGNGATKFKELLLKEIPDIKFEENNIQTAENAGKAGFRKMQKNDVVNADEIMPIYLKKSNAERQKGEKSENK